MHSVCRPLPEMFACRAASLLRHTYHGSRCYTSDSSSACSLPLSSYHHRFFISSMHTTYIQPYATPPKPIRGGVHAKQQTDQTKASHLLTQPCRPPPYHLHILAACRQAYAAWHSTAPPPSFGALCLTRLTMSRPCPLLHLHQHAFAHPNASYRKCSFSSIPFLRSSATETSVLLHPQAHCRLIFPVTPLFPSSTSYLATEPCRSRKEELFALVMHLQ